MSSELLIQTLEDLGAEDFKIFKWYLHHKGALEDFPAIPKSRLEHADRHDTVDLLVQTYRGNAGKVAIITLGKMQKNELVEVLSDATSEPTAPASRGGGSGEETGGGRDDKQEKEALAECQQKLTSTLRQKFQCVFEGIAKAGNPTLLKQIYTELLITEGGSGEVNNEHEVRQLETASRKPEAAEATVRHEDIFRGSAGREEPIRTVVTRGVAGIGKTLLTQKFTLDWVEVKSNQDVHFMFPFTFRELNVLKNKKFSLVELVHHFFPQTKAAGICRFEDFRVVFIFDGLDECRLPLAFDNNETLTDETKSTSVDVLLTNLIRRNLLPSARLWITTRPAAANQIPPECVDLVTEVRGFTDPQKEEYFRRRFRDEEQASRVVSHIKTSRSLHIMCHIPVFCWITATVLEDLLKTREGAELPKTLTEMYIHFLVVQSKRKNIKYDGGAEMDPHWSPETRLMIESLGKLAFQQLQKRNLIFYESDLKESGIDVQAASVTSGVLTQIFKEERGLYREKVFCFVHLSVQEFLAALHVHLTFTNSGVNLLSHKRPSYRSKVFRDKNKLVQFYQTAVKKALQSPNGHLDLFLRFLLGLSLQTNHILLRGLLVQTDRSDVNQETVQYIKKKISEISESPERTINLFHCLNELNDGSLVQEIQQSLSSGRLSTKKLSPAQWSALGFILLCSEEYLDVFDLKKFSASEEALLRLLPVVKASNKAVLSGCNLSERSWKVLSSVLGSQPSGLRELDLSHNSLQDSGVKLLCAGLERRHSTQSLRLSGCSLSERSCEALASIICSRSSGLEELDLSLNRLRDSGVKLLSAALQRPHCRLQRLRLSGCSLSGGSCETLASVLGRCCSLRHVDLSDNDLQDWGVKLLAAALRRPCRLDSLRLSGCMVSEQGCASLASALSSSPSHLKELDLSYNHPGEAGVELLTAPRCRPDTLRLDHGGLQRLRPGLRKYACELELDPNTANRDLRLSDSNRRVTHEEDQSYPDHPDRFDSRPQLLCKDGLTGRCYWEVQWVERVYVSVSYRGNGGLFGRNDRSWCLDCSDFGYSVWHNNRQSSAVSSCVSGRVGVYVDCPAGTLSFYRVSSDRLVHLHTFHATFTEPLYPGFTVYKESSVSLCHV